VRRYKPYPKYKESGVEWLGEVPEHWKTTKLKYHANIYNGNSISDNQKSNYENQENTTSTPYISTKDIDADYFTIKYNNGLRIPNHIRSSFKIAKATSTLICIEGGSAGKKLAYLDCDVCFVNKLACITSLKSLNAKFLNYFSHTSLFKYEFKLITTGLIPGVSISELKDILLLLPPLQEQQAIADYLDRDTAKIDTLIDKQRRLIELLKEKRQALISHAVTKGLDPNVKMKDSGVEWLGEVPEHWEVMKLKFIAHTQPSNIDKKSKENEANVLLCNYTDVYKNDYITNNMEFMKATATYEQIKKFKLDVGDVIITKDSEGPEDIAIAAYVQETQPNLVCGYHLTQIKPRHCNGAYLFRAFNSNGIHDQFKVAANGITRYGLSVYGIDNAYFPVPPFKEQNQIANYLDTQTQKIDTLIEKANQAITLLEERRTALISAAVTGKIDVREVEQ